MPDDSNVQMISNHQHQTVIFKVLPPRPAGSIIKTLFIFYEPVVVELHTQPEEEESTLCPIWSYKTNEEGGSSRLLKCI